MKNTYKQWGIIAAKGWCSILRRWTREVWRNKKKF